MRLLLDTHVLLWWIEGDRSLTRKAKNAIADPGNECLVSLASAWELSIKSALGKIRLAIPVRRYLTEQLASNGFRLLELTLSQVCRVEALPLHHRDPFDRLLVAQALEEGLSVVTADAVFGQYGIKRVW